jgi:hypothetical protein
MNATDGYVGFCDYDSYMDAVDAAKGFVATNNAYYVVHMDALLHVEPNPQVVVTDYYDCRIR